MFLIALKQIISYKKLELVPESEMQPKPKYRKFSLKSCKEFLSEVVNEKM